MQVLELKMQSRKAAAPMLVHNVQGSSQVAHTSLS